MIDTIVDLNHDNDFPNVTFPPGITGVIHKATQGLTFRDQAYAHRRMLATHAGVLWGAYHFATDADGTAQADAFLHAAQPEPHTLMALDLEHNPSGATVRLPQARAFVARIKQVTGRFPFVYGSDLLVEFMGSAGDPLLSRCPLWIARYSHKPPVVPPGWDKWVLWQYLAGETAGIDDHLPGFGAVDRNRFNGDLAALKAVWAT